MCSHRIQLLLLVLCGCSPMASYAPPDQGALSIPSYEDARDSCGLAPDEYIPLVYRLPELFDDGWKPELDSWAGLAWMEHPIDEECARVLGVAIGMDWEAFGTEPHSFDSPSTTADLVISGMAQLLMGDFGTIQQVQDTLNPAELFAQEYPDGIDQGRKPTDPLGAFLFEYVAERIERVVPVPHAECDAVMAYTDEAVWYCLDEDWIFDRQLAFDVRDAVQVLPIALASTLVHEAGHRSGPPHVDYGTDADCSGVIYAQVRTLRSWADEAAYVVDYDEWGIPVMHATSKCAFFIQEINDWCDCYPYPDGDWPEPW